MTLLGDGARRLDLLSRSRRFIPTLLALFLALPVALHAQETSQTVLHLLDYIAVDYATAVENGKIKNPDEYHEMREFVGQVESAIEDLPANPAQPQLRAAAAELTREIEAKAGAIQITAKANALRQAVIRAYQVQVAPKRLPDLKRGAELYASQCAACHGVAGRGDGPAGKTSIPPRRTFTLSSAWRSAASSASITPSRSVLPERV